MVNIGGMISGHPEVLEDLGLIEDDDDLPSNDSGNTPLGEIIERRLRLFRGPWFNARTFCPRRRGAGAGAALRHFWHCEPLQIAGAGD